MTVAEAITKLTPRTSPMPKDAIQCLRDNWEEAEAILLKALDEAIENPLDEPPALFDYALFLCAEMRCEAAFERYINICRLSTLIIENLVGDLITESIEYMLAQTCFGRFEELKAVIEDQTRDAFARATAFDALRNLTADGKFPLNDLRSYCIELLEFRLEPQRSFIWESVIFSSVDLGLTEALPLIEEAYTNNFIDDYLYPFDDMTCDMAESSGSLKKYQGYISGMPEDEMLYVEDWPETERAVTDIEADIIEELLKQNARADHFKEASSKAPAGRNDPCPCGSGKKYKKCCINKKDADVWEAPKPANYADQLIDCGYFNYDKQSHYASILCWNQAWREIVDTNMIPGNIINPEDQKCELFDCCTSFRVWIEDFLQIIIKDDHISAYAAKKSIITIREIINKFPAMDNDTRAHAEYALADLLAKTGQPDKAETAFTQSLNHSIRGTGSYFLHSLRKSFDAKKYNMCPDWAKSLEYAEKAKELADDALIEVVPFDEHIERIKNTMRMYKTRTELAKKAN